MKKFCLNILFLGILYILTSGTALATISVVKGSLSCFVGCNKDVVQLVAQGQEFNFEVVGNLVDTSTAVEPASDRGVTLSYGTRKSGSGSSIIVKINVAPDAALGERTVKMRYLVEVNGFDSFKIKVVPRGRISQIQYRRPIVSQLNLSTRDTFELVAPTGMPLNEKVILIVTGTKLANVEVRPQTTYRSTRIVSATETQATIEMEFSSASQGPLVLFDSALSSQDMNSSGSTKFSYTDSPTIQYGGSGSGTGFVSPTLSGGGSTPAGFIDAAPRVTMFNIFRRQSQTAAFTENGVQYFSLDSSQNFCSGMSGNQSRIITVQNPTWGVTNVGTANINTAFTAQLKSGGQILQTQTINSLTAGASQSFVHTRPGDSQVRVFTFLTRGGCFVSPTADKFFEDPPFTVAVNTTNTLAESSTANNTRNF